MGDHRDRVFEYKMGGERRSDFIREGYFEFDIRFHRERGRIR